MMSGSSWLSVSCCVFLAMSGDQAVADDTPIANQNVARPLIKASLEVNLPGLTASNLKELGEVTAVRFSTEAAAGTAQIERKVLFQAGERQKSITLPADVDLPRLMASLAVSGGTASIQQLTNLQQLVIERQTPGNVRLRFDQPAAADWQISYEIDGVYNPCDGNIRLVPRAEGKCNPNSSGAADALCVWNCDCHDGTPEPDQFGSGPGFHRVVVIRNRTGIDWPKGIPLTIPLQYSRTLTVISPGVPAASSARVVENLVINESFTLLARIKSQNLPLDPKQTVLMPLGLAASAASMNPNGVLKLADCPVPTVDWTLSVRWCDNRLRFVVPVSQWKTLVAGKEAVTVAADAGVVVNRLINDSTQQLPYEKVICEGSQWRACEQRTWKVTFRDVFPWLAQVDFPVAVEAGKRPFLDQALFPEVVNCGIRQSHNFPYSGPFTFSSAAAVSGSLLPPTSQAASAIGSYAETLKRLHEGAPNDPVIQEISELALETRQHMEELEATSLQSQKLVFRAAFRPLSGSTSDNDNIVRKQGAIARACDEERERLWQQLELQVRQILRF